MTNIASLSDILQDLWFLNGISALITKITPILETLMNKIVLTL